MHALLTHTFKDIPPQLLDDSVKKIMPEFDNKEFNALNKLESQRFVILEKKLRKYMRKNLIMYIEKILHLLFKYPGTLWLLMQSICKQRASTTSVNAATEGEKESQTQSNPVVEVHVSAQGEQQSSNQDPPTSTALVVHSSNEEPQAKKLRVVLDYPIPAPTPLNTAMPDFQENSDDEVDERTSEENLRDLNIDSQNESKIQKDYKTEYKKVKATLALLEASPSTTQSPKPFQSKNKGLVAKTFDWDEKEVSDDEEMTQVKVLMALADDELAIEKNHARNGEWIATP
ncbi:hypothetical protein Tco_0344151 [Tanacetum coccineum]